MCESWKRDPAGLDDAALAELVVEVQAEADRLEAWRLRVLGEWDARAVWAADGACNGASWLAALGNVARSVAGGLLHDARRLRGMPVTAAAARRWWPGAGQGPPVGPGGQRPHPGGVRA